MHSPQHARNELVDPITLANEGYECGDSTFVVRANVEVGEDELLEGVDFVLELHKVGDCFITIAVVRDQHSLVA